MDHELKPAQKTEVLTIQPWPPDRHPAAVYLASLAYGSRPTMKQALESIAALATDDRRDAQSMNWPALRYQHTAAIRAALAERFAPATANKMLSALRGVLRECWRLRYMTAEDFHRAADMKSIRGDTLPRGRSLDRGEINALFAACAKDTTPAGVRDATIIALLYGCGMRRAEVVGLAVEDYDRRTGELRVHGKGNRERLVYATNGSKDALEDWLSRRGAEPGPLFVSIRKGGHIARDRMDEGMTSGAVYDVLKKRARHASVPEFSPHDLRRTFVGDMLDAGADISVVQRLAGHARINTTQRYDRRPEDAKRKAAELMFVPYRSRS
ncbi:MAG: tyrosine-type recombinase/integrase [Planctomycetes bacterium]|nr:tyrosine-type recombinase/integrase [Planctomycetota bacterium]